MKVKSRSKIRKRAGAGERRHRPLSQVRFARLIRLTILSESLAQAKFIVDLQLTEATRAIGCNVYASLALTNNSSAPNLVPRVFPLKNGWGGKRP